MASTLASEKSFNYSRLEKKSHKNFINAFYWWRRWLLISARPQSTHARTHAHRHRQIRTNTKRAHAPLTQSAGSHKSVHTPFTQHVRTHTWRAHTHKSVDTPLTQSACVHTHTHTRTCTRTRWSLPDILNSHFHPSTAPTKGRNSKSKKSKAGLIAGVVVTLLVLVAGAVVGLFYYRWHQRKKQFAAQQFVNVQDLPPSDA